MKPKKSEHMTRNFCALAIVTAVTFGFSNFAVAQASPEERTTPADPSAEVAALVRAYVTGWVSGQTDSSGDYSIPPRGEHDVEGSMGDFHTVHSADDDTYYVCVDFHDGESTYDVDFYIDETDDGLSVTRHFLHKIDGEEVQDETD